MIDKTEKDDEDERIIKSLSPDNITRIIDNVTKSNRTASRDRPYDGQPHTDEGIRGKTLVRGLTFRDVCDCMAAGLLEASEAPELQDTAEKGTWQYNDLYMLEMDLDPIAAIQAMSCNLEKMMGLYPLTDVVNDEGYIKIGCFREISGYPIESRERSFELCTDCGLSDDKKDCNSYITENEFTVLYKKAKIKSKR